MPALRARRAPDFLALHELIEAAALNLERGALPHILDALPDQAVATLMLNMELEAATLWLEPDAAGNGWRLTSRPRVERSRSFFDDAAFGLARFVEVGGWHRVKRCAVTGCGRPYLDLTNGNLRRYCDDHRH